MSIPAVPIAPDDMVHRNRFKGARTSSNRLALRQAGFPDARMHSGSWNERPCEHSLPIGTGLPVARSSQQPGQALAA